MNRQTARIHPAGCGEEALVAAIAAAISPMAAVAAFAKFADEIEGWPLGPASAHAESFAPAAVDFFQ